MFLGIGQGMKKKYLLCLYLLREITSRKSHYGPRQEHVEWGGGRGHPPAREGLKMQSLSKHNLKKMHMYANVNYKKGTGVNVF